MSCFLWFLPVCVGEPCRLKSLVLFNIQCRIRFTSFVQKNQILWAPDVLDLLEIYLFHCFLCSFCLTLMWSHECKQPPQQLTSCSSPSDVESLQSLSHMDLIANCICSLSRTWYLLAQRVLASTRLAKGPAQTPASIHRSKQCSKIWCFPCSQSNPASVSLRF